MATRNQVAASSSRPDEIEYFLFVQGIPIQCRWQDLKDVLRKIPPEGHIRQAHTDNENGIGWGQITILNKAKAFNSFDYLVGNGWRGHSIRLTLVIKDQSHAENLRRLRGPEDSLVGTYNGGHAAMYSSLGQSSTLPVCPSTMPLAMQPIMSLQQPFLSSYNSYQPLDTFESQGFAQQSSSSYGEAHHRHSTTAPHANNKPPSPLLTRCNHPNKSTDHKSRTIYIYNLPYDVKEQALKGYLAPAGVVDRCLVKEDLRRAPRHKLTAVATFRTPQQAHTAIDCFNGKLWKGFEMKIKLDRGPNIPGSSDAKMSKGKPSTSSRPKDDRTEAREGPLVVNGSGPSVLSQHYRVDSDDDSSSDEGTKGPSCRSLAHK